MRKYLLLALLLVPGCAAQDLKPCDKVTIHAVRTEQGPMFVMDMEGLETLGRRMTGLWEKTCSP